jgi:hypothetical protein
MRIIISSFVLVFCSFLNPLTAANFQEESPADSIPPSSWKIGGISSFNLNQVSLTNWSGGGSESVAGSVMLKSFFNYSKKKVSWDNTFDFGYGLSKQGDANAIKTEDKLQFASKYGYAAAKYWYYSALVDFKTQMDMGYKDPPTNLVMISKFMAPAYITSSLGMDFKRSENLSIYLSPLTSKMTIVNNETLSNSGAYGVKSGETMRSEYGASAKLVAKKKDLVKNVDGLTRLDLFSNLAHNPQNVDVDWEATALMRINKLLTAMVSFNLIYDDDIKYVSSDGVSHGARAQLKQMLGFGLTYKFGEAKK